MNTEHKYFNYQVSLTNEMYESIGDMTDDFAEDYLETRFAELLNGIVHNINQNKDIACEYTGTDNSIYILDNEHFEVKQIGD